MTKSTSPTTQPASSTQAVAFCSAQIPPDRPALAPSTIVGHSSPLAIWSIPRAASALTRQPGPAERNAAQCAARCGQMA